MLLMDNVNQYVDSVKKAIVLPQDNVQNVKNIILLIMENVMTVIL